MGAGLGGSAAAPEPPSTPRRSNEPSERREPVRLRTARAAPLQLGGSEFRPGHSHRSQELGGTAPSLSPSPPASRSPGAAPVSTLQTELLERTNTFREPPAALLPVS